MRHLRGGTLPALTLKATRVTLLAWSYEDALFSERGETSARSTPQSKLLTFNQDLWRRGSYAELQHALESLRTTHRREHHEFWEAFVQTRRVATHHARVALALVVGQMPAFVYVPAEVSEAKGYRPAEAALYDRKGKSRAA